VLVSGRLLANISKALPAKPVNVDVDVDGTQAAHEDVRQVTYRLVVSSWPMAYNFTARTVQSAPWTAVDPMVSLAGRLSRFIATPERSSQLRGDV
jgi:hypothetical protein